MENKYKSNNVILLIGNGFDLAHGFRTSYTNFAEWFVTKIEKEIINYFDTRKTSILSKGFIFFLKDFKYVNNTQTDKITNIIKTYLGDYSKVALIETMNNNLHKIKGMISNDFLGKLYDNQYKNWFDIENAYFQELIRLKGYFVDANNNPGFLKDIKKLNTELTEIKEYLKEYLDSIEIKSNEEINGFFNTIKIFDNLDYNIFIINFNYTDTIEHYFSEFTEGGTNLKSVKINYIHGNLREDNIIFGYGNDKHKEYQKIKDLEENKFLENFKTFAYLKNNNYNKIYDDILDNNSIDEYIVFVLGHSLGATDKTLLEEVFNNAKCKKIHLFKRRNLKGNEEKLEKSFNNLVFSASRILRNEKDLRKKILNYEDSKYFP